jgi:RNA polymerase sigma factor (sigma-70 family)
MSKSPQTRASLLLRIRDMRDEEAWAEFVQIYGPVVYRLARKHGLQDADASDVTQEVFRDVVGAAGRFDYDPERGSFRGWLFTVARNRLRKFAGERRRRGTAGGGQLAVQPAPEEAANWDREYEQRLFEWAAAKSRDHFRESTWQAFWRTAVGEEEPAAVAAALGMSVGAVYIARSRVLARIRQELLSIEGRLPTAGTGESA